MNAETQALAAANLPVTETGQIIIKAASTMFRLPLDAAAAQVRRYCEDGDRDALQLICFHVAEEMVPGFPQPTGQGAAAFVRAARKMSQRVH